MYICCVCCFEDIPVAEPWTLCPHLGILRVGPPLKTCSQHSRTCTHRTYTVTNTTPRVKPRGPPKQRESAHKIPQHTARKFSLLTMEGRAASERRHQRPLLLHAAVILEHYCLLAWWNTDDVETQQYAHNAHQAVSECTDDHHQTNNTL